MRLALGRAPLRLRPPLPLRPAPALALSSCPLSLRHPPALLEYACRSAAPRLLGASASSLFSTCASRRDRRPAPSSAAATVAEAAAPPPTDVSLLPVSCPGCGALAHTIEPAEAGHYQLTRKAVREYLRKQHRRIAKEALLLEQEEANREQALQSDETSKGCSEDSLSAPDATAEGKDPEAEPDSRASPPAQADTAPVEAHPETQAETTQEEPQPAAGTTDTEPPPQITPPLCDRCNQLQSQNRSEPIVHPPIEAIAETIAESPHRLDHVYHVLDAADFPMSLIPNIHRKLEIAKPRTQNRRSKDVRWSHGRRTELSFVVTRADLLAPAKEQVDRMMPYLMDVLRDALGRRLGPNIRLGTMFCVSSKRGWWTRPLKDEIYARGGGNWLVGKVNVGKSNLLESVFPRGGGRDRVQPARLARPLRPRPGHPLDHASSAGSDPFDPTVLSPTSLLPPPQPYTPYPTLPLVNALPGTTASPIRLPFGSSSSHKPKGELIDLPGIERSTLEAYVKPEFRSRLLMEHRAAPERVSIKPGQSLTIGGGLVRVTPRFPDGLVFLSAAFLPTDVKAHVTSTRKAVDIESGERGTGLDRLISPEGERQFRSAGIFELKWDITRANAGPLTRKSDVGIHPDRLPFVILGADVLIEGVGWVEMTVQIRRRWLEEQILEAQEQTCRKEGETAPAEGLEGPTCIPKGGSGADEAANVSTVEADPCAQNTLLPTPDLEEPLSKETEEVNQTENNQTEQLDQTKEVNRTEEINQTEETNQTEDRLTDTTDTPKTSPQPEPLTQQYLARLLPGSLLQLAFTHNIVPTIEVFSPLGKHIGIRRPMNGYELGGKKPPPKHLRTKRPRQSMRSIKGRRAPGTPTGVSSKDSPLKLK